MTLGSSPYSDLTALLRRNAELDAEVLEVARQVPLDALHASQGSDRWTIAEQLAHIAEFPEFFAGDLARWIADGGSVARTHDHPGRLAAVAAARHQSLEQFLSRIERAFGRLAEVLGRLTPEHLSAAMENRKYGREPFPNYVKRYIIGHKENHLGQLRRSLDYLAGGRIRLSGHVPVPRATAEQYRRDGLWQGRTLGELFDRWAVRSGTALALVGTTVDGVEERLSYSTLLGRVESLSGNLHACGIGPGSLVLVQLPNTPAFATLLFALFKIGALPVLALPPHREHEIGHLLEQSGATSYAVPRAFRGFDYLAMARRLRDSHRSLEQILVSGATADGDVVSLDALEASGPRAPLPGPVASDVALFLLSGGTTGLPRLIPRTHDDYALNIRESARVCGLTEDAVYLAALPIAHNFPLGCPGMLGTFHAGGRVVMCPSPDPETALALLERERVTVTAAVPAVAIRWMESAELARRDLSSLRLLQVGGQRFQPEHARQVAPKLGCRLQQVFGMAEGLLNFTRLDDPDEIVLETQGRPLLSQDEISIVDGNGDPVPDGDAGELLTRGPYTIRGYFRAATHNASAFTTSGWYRTGDVVRWHKGNLVVEGRTKDAINRGGEKISAEEVESIIISHPAVLNAAVVGVPHPVLGERVCAYLVTRDGSPLALPDLAEFLLARGLAKFKIPELAETVPELPLTNVGKVDKRALRDAHARLARE